MALAPPSWRFSQFASKPSVPSHQQAAKAKVYSLLSRIDSISRLIIYLIIGYCLKLIWQLLVLLSCLIQVLMVKQGTVFHQVQHSLINCVPLGTALSNFVPLGSVPFPLRSFPLGFLLLSLGMYENDCLPMPLPVNSPINSIGITRIICPCQRISYCPTLLSPYSLPVK